MRLSFFFIFFFLIACNEKSGTKTDLVISEGEVLVCISGTAYAYHQKGNCQGLRKCTHKIVKMSLTEAKEEMGREPCGYCCH